MNKLMQQAAEMQAQMQKMQEEAAAETAEASVGGGMVKVTRPASDLSRESVSYRLERLEQRAPGAVEAPVAAAAPMPPSAPRPAEPAAAAPDIELEQLQEAWSRQVIPAVEERGGIPAASLLREAHPTLLAGDTLTVEFPASAQFHRSLAEDPKNATVLADALYDVTGRRLALAFAVGDVEVEGALELDEPAGEERIIELLKADLDARERDLE